jgi:hypothetical protein
MISRDQIWNVVHFEEGVSTQTQLEPKGNSSPDRTVGQQECLHIASRDGEHWSFWTPQDYKDKINALLADPTYEHISCNPMKQVKEQMKKLMQQSAIPMEPHKHVILRNTRRTPLYILPKIYKFSVLL